jgi:uncharacterized repeat protein (TIGR01451 family)
VCNVPPGTSYTVAKSASPAGPVSPGATVTYTETVTNTGDTAYPGATAGFTDDLTGVLSDATVVPGSVTATAGTAAISGNMLTWTGPLTVAPDPAATATVSYQVTVNNPDTGNLKLVNNVTATGGGTCATATGCTTTVPVTPPAPTTTKAAAQTSFVAGETINYTYTVTNNAGVPLSAVAVTDNGPGTPTVTCPSATLAAGASEQCTATYVATQADAVVGSITDTAKVTATAPNGDTVTATSNTVTLPTTTQPCPPPPVCVPPPCVPPVQVP